MGMKQSVEAVKPSSKCVERSHVEDKKLKSLDEKIVDSIKELRVINHEEGRQKINPFNKIILKFPSIAQAFNGVRRTFDEYDKNHSGTISISDLEAVLTRLSCDFTEMEIKEIFSESDFDHNGELSFKEFLVCLAIGFVLHRIPVLEEGGEGQLNQVAKIQSKSPRRRRASQVLGEGNALRNAFQLAIDAFLWFDVDANGSIQREEMTARLQSSMHTHSPSKRMSKLSRNKNSKAEVSATNPMTSFITDRRFQEMDWDHDGSITFKEFLMAFESWVGVEDTDDISIDLDGDELLKQDGSESQGLSSFEDL